MQVTTEFLNNLPHVVRVLFDQSPRLLHARRFWLWRFFASVLFARLAHEENLQSDAYMGFGACSPGDESHSVMWEAISACRAWRIICSRSMPCSALAFALNPWARSARRSSKETSCLTQRRFMTRSS